MHLRSLAFEFSWPVDEQKLITAFSGSFNECHCSVTVRFLFCSGFVILGSIMQVGYEKNEFTWSNLYAYFISLKRLETCNLIVDGEVGNTIHWSDWTESMSCLIICLQLTIRGHVWRVSYPYSRLCFHNRDPVYCSEDSRVPSLKWSDEVDGDSGVLPLKCYT
jgi:hypothetical protein